jgi:Flp pilus assembly protein TadG
MRFIAVARFAARSALLAAHGSLRRAGLHLRARGGSEDGQAIVEMAYMAPVLLLLTFGMCMFGLALNNQLALTNAVQQGAQQLAISRGVSDPCDTAVTAIEAAAPNLNWSATGIVWSFTIGSGSSSSDTCTSLASDMTSGATATVSVTYPFTNGIIGTAKPSPAGGWSFASSFSLYATTTEVIQ